MEAKISAIKQQLSHLYDIRYNTITCKLEYKHKDKEEYTEVSRTILKGFQRELKEAGLFVKEAEILKSYEAGFSPDADPKFKKLMEDTELYIDTAYEIRYNTLKSRVEYKEKDEWKIVDKIFVNNLVRELRTRNMQLSKDKLWDLLESNFSQMINPLQQYLSEIEFNPAGDRISDLLDTVKTNSENWNLYFTKWLVATCANAFTPEKNTNHTMVILCGQQGAFKTTWIENLLPKKIKSFMFSGKLPIDHEKDGLAVLAEYMVVNLDDQMKELQKRNGYERMKNIITIDRVEYRKPYDRQITVAPRLASFIGSVNGTDVLADPTGDRRYLPFEVESIDINTAKKLDMENIWAEVYMLYKSGFRYYFTPEEVSKIINENKEFTVQSPIEEELLLKFTPAQENTKYATFLLTSQIAEALGSNKIDPSNRKLGEALTRHHFTKQRRRINGNAPMWGYWVMYNETLERLKEYPEIEEQLSPSQPQPQQLELELEPF